jgi:hypothetical protein
VKLLSETAMLPPGKSWGVDEGVLPKALAVYTPEVLCTLLYASSPLRHLYGRMSGVTSLLTLLASTTEVLSSHQQPPDMFTHC